MEISLKGLQNIFCAMGPKIEGKGEIKIESQLYQNEFAQTMAK
jgi:hypothetical protein